MYITALAHEVRTSNNVRNYSITHPSSGFCWVIEGSDLFRSGTVELIGSILAGSGPIRTGDVVLAYQSGITTCARKSATLVSFGDLIAQIEQSFFY